MVTDKDQGTLAFVDEFAHDALYALVNSRAFDGDVEYILDRIKRRNGEFWYVWSPRYCIHGCERWT